MRISEGNMRIINPAGSKGFSTSPHDHQQITNQKAKPNATKPDAGSDTNYLKKDTLYDIKKSLERFKANRKPLVRKKPPSVSPIQNTADTEKPPDVIKLERKMGNTATSGSIESKSVADSPSSPSTIPLALLNYVPKKGDNFKGGVVEEWDKSKAIVKVIKDDGHNKTIEYYTPNGKNWTRVTSSSKDWNEWYKNNSYTGWLQVTSRYDDWKKLHKHEQLQYLKDKGAPNHILADYLSKNTGIERDSYGRVESVTKIIDEVSSNLKKQNTALKDLKGYNSIKAALDGGVSVQTLKDAGYSDEVIKVGGYSNIADAIKAGVSEQTLVKARVPYNVINQVGNNIISYESFKRSLSKILDYKVTDDNYDKALKEYNEIIKAQEKLKPYTAKDGSIDVFEAVKNEDKDIVTMGLGIGDKQYNAYKHLSSYAMEDGSIDIVKAIQDGWSKTEIQTATGISDKDYKEYAWAAEYEDAHWLRQQQMGISKAWDEDAGGFAKDTALDFVPIAGTVNRWDDISTGEKVGYLALDIVSLIPFIGGVAAGVRGGSTIAKSLKTMAIAEVKAPVTAVRHPIATAKTALAPIETVLHPKKLPLAATEIQWNTVRVEVKELGTSKEGAMAIRDIATDKAIRGEKAIAELEGTKMELAPAALQKSIGPVAVHACPDTRPFYGGTIIEPGKEGKGMFVAPALTERFSHASAFGIKPKPGAVRGALIINDPKVLQSLNNTNKIYRKWVEMEKAVPPHYKLPAPSQTLFTRDIAGNKLELLIIGKPLNAGQISKLKFYGATDTVKQIFQKPAKVTKAGRSVEMSMDKLSDTSAELTKLEKELKAAKKAGKSEKVLELEAKIKRLANEELLLRKEVRRSYVNRKPLAAAGIYMGKSEILRRSRTPERPAKGRIAPRLGKVNKPMLRSRIPQGKGKSNLRPPIRLEKPGVTPRVTPKNARTRTAPNRPDGYRGDPVRPPRTSPRPPRSPRPPGTTPPVITPPDTPTTKTGGGKGKPRFNGKVNESKKQNDIKAGRIAWRQGALKRDGEVKDQWIKLIPRANGKGYIRVYTEKKPDDALILKRTPKETFFTKGGDLPKDLKMQMGIMKVNISTSGKPRISFRRR